MVAEANGTGKEPHLSGVSNLMDTGYMISLEMYGNGQMIGMEKNIISIALKVIRWDQMQTAKKKSCEEVHGTHFQVIFGQVIGMRITHL